MANKIYIEFATNAPQVAGQVADLQKVINNIATQQQNARPGFTAGGTAAVAGSLSSISSSLGAGNTAASRADIEQRLKSELESIMASKLPENIKKTAQSILDNFDTHVGQFLTEEAGEINNLITSMKGLSGRGSGVGFAKTSIKNMVEQKKLYVKKVEGFNDELAKTLEKDLGQARLLQDLERLQGDLAKMGINTGDLSNVESFTKVVGNLVSVSTGLNAEFALITKYWQEAGAEDEEKLTQLQQIARRAMSLASQQKTIFSSQLSRSVTENPQQFGTNLAGALGEKYGGNLSFSGESGAVEAEAIAGVLNTKVSGALADFINVKATTEYENLQKLLTSSEKLPKGKQQEQIQTALQKLRARIDQDITNLTTQVEALTMIPTDNAEIKRAQENLTNALRSEIARMETFFNNQAELLNEAATAGLRREIKSITGRLGSLVGSTAYSAHTFEGIAAIANATSDAASQIVSRASTLAKGYTLSTEGGRAVDVAQVMGAKRAENLVSSSLGQAGYFKPGESLEYYRQAIVKAQAIMAEKVRESVTAFEKKTKDKITDSSKESLMQSLEVAFTTMTTLLKNLENDVGILSSDIEGATRSTGKAIAKEKGVKAGVDYVSQPENFPVGRFRPSMTRSKDLTPDDIRAKNADELSGSQKNAIQGNVGQVELLGDRQVGKLAEFSRISGQVLSTWMGLQFAFDMSIGKMVEFINQANELDRAATTVYALGKTWENFSYALRLAGEQQAKFGGNLAEIAQAMTAVIPMSLQYGISLEKVNEISQRLAILNPMQGYEGAAIALKEFFGGNVTSLSRRFEIDRTTLNNVLQLGDSVDRLNALDKALNNMGVSTELLTARTQSSAVAFDRAAATSNNLSIMAGQMSRNWFSGMAEAYSSWGEFAQQSVLRTQEMQDAIIDAEKKFSIVNERFQSGMRGNAGAVDMLNESLGKTQKDNLINNFNAALKNLNELRSLNNEAAIKLFSEKDERTVKQLLELSKLSGIPITSLIKNSLTDTGVIDLNRTSKDKMRSDAPAWWDPLAAGKDAMIGFTNDFGLLKQVEDIEKLTGKAAAKTVAVNLGNRTSYAYREALAGVTQEANVLTPMQLQGQKDTLRRNYGIDFDTTMATLLDSYKVQGKTNEEYNTLVLQMIEVTRKLVEAKEKTTQVESSYVEKLRKDITEFGGSSMKDELVKQLDTLTQNQAQTSQSIAAQRYAALGGGAGMTDAVPTEEYKDLLKYAQAKLGIDRESLYYLSQTQRVQAQQTLNANRTLSAYTALSNQMRGQTVTLQDAVNLSMSFKRNIESIVTSSIVPQLNLSDQSNYYMTKLQGSSNMDDATQSLNSYLGILKQTEQKKLDAGDAQRKYNEDMQKMTRDHNDKLAKITKDGEEERNKIIKEFADKAAELLAQSEISKRQSKYDFYSGLFGMENLTPEQMKAGSAKYEQLYAEASALRNKGEFTKADQILQTGSRVVQDELTYQNAVGEQKQRIKDADKEIAEINKEMREATSFDQVNSLKDKIKEIQLDKDKANLRIRQLDELRKLQKDAADEELKQIRLKEDAEKKALQQKIDDNKKAVDKQASDENDAYTKLQDDKEKSFKESLRKQQEAQILNIKQMTDLESASTAIMTAARLAAGGASQNTIDSALAGYEEIKRRFANDKSPAGKAIYEWFKSQDATKPVAMPSVTPFTPGTPYGTIPDYVNYRLNGNPSAKSMTDLPASVDNNTTAVNNLTKSNATLNVTLAALPDKLDEVIRKRVYN
jgi:hypothetical protein